MPLSLLLVALTVFTGSTDQNATSEAVELDQSTNDVRGLFTGNVMMPAGTPPSREASADVRVIWETSHNNRDWLPAARAELSGLGPKVAEVSFDRLYAFVRVRLELRGGAIVKEGVAELLSTGKLVKPPRPTAKAAEANGNASSS